MTGLPFVYAAWTGRAGAIGADDVRLLQEASADGVASYPAIADEYGKGSAAAAQRALAYLRDNMRYGFGADDVDNVTASDEAPLGHRRAPLEDVRRNIEAAGLEPAERDGRFAIVA